jgi:hypothetical protein
MELDWIGSFIGIGLDRFISSELVWILSMELDWILSLELDRSKIGYAATGDKRRNPRFLS